MNHEDVDVIAPQETQALVNRFTKGVDVLGIEGLRPTAELGGDDERRIHADHGPPNRQFAVGISGRGIDRIDAQFDRPLQDSPGLRFPARQ